MDKPGLVLADRVNELHEHLRAVRIGHVAQVFAVLLWFGWVHDHLVVHVVYPEVFLALSSGPGSMPEAPFAEPCRAGHFPEVSRE